MIPANPSAPVRTLKGVGPALTEQLGRLGITRLLDLLLHLPLRYQDRSRLVPLGSLTPEQEGLVEGQIVESRLAYGRRRSLVVTLEDGTGYLRLRFFYFSRAQENALRPGVHVRAFGQARLSRDGIEIVHPEYRTYAATSPPPAPEPELTPIYPTTRGLGQGRLRSLTDQLLALRWPEADGTPYADLRFLHRPPAEASAEQIADAQARIALDELTAYYLVMRHRQSARGGQQTMALPQAAHLGRVLLEHLGFRLTGAQRRVTTEVLEDLASERPMLRLLQGDVGSGKTVIAAFAAIRAAEHGGQTALMAPTEILAEQHYLNFVAWLEPLGVSVVLLTGSQTAAERKRAVDAIESGEALVAVGTHALFQDQVRFARLALTVVDEQHRFGVHQRMALKDKGALPHQLVMTATPIPRTLTMALYADMDVSTLDELPAGRQPITTVTVAEDRRGEVIARVAAEIEAGRQAYWVCPLIGTSDAVNAMSVEEIQPVLAEALPGIRIGTLHGRMKATEKADVMAAFKRGDVQLLLATTVVEVGVDVPNATLMVIENPERMGLAQLHQLRGRVGRGRYASHCVLLYATPLTETGRARLAVIRDSQDGFHIAEEDLKIRGPGDLMGTRQTGEQQFRIADLRTHAHLIPEVVRRGDALLAGDPATAARLLDIWAPADSGHLGV